MVRNLLFIVFVQLRVPMLAKGQLIHSAHIPYLFSIRIASGHSVRDLFKQGMQPAKSDQQIKR